MNTFTVCVSHKKSLNILNSTFDPTYMYIYIIYIVFHINGISLNWIGLISTDCNCEKDLSKIICIFIDMSVYVGG